MKRKYIAKPGHVVTAGRSIHCDVDYKQQIEQYRIFGYTADELERLWDTITSVSDEELETMIRGAARR